MKIRIADCSLLMGNNDDIMEAFYNWEMFLNSLPGSILSYTSVFLDLLVFSIIVFVLLC